MRALSDVFTKDKRSQIMSRVRSTKNKSTELRVLKLLKDNEIKGWRRNYDVDGKPDFVFLKIKAAIFVDGCFWHGHDCRNTRPKSNEEYWEKKRETNIFRDREVTERFIERGWKVLRIWECELKKSRTEETLAKIKEFLSDTERQ